MLPQSSKFLQRPVLLQINNNFRKIHNSSVGVIGASFWNGQSKIGTEHGPDELRAAGLLKRLSKIQPNVADFAEMCNDLSEFVGALCDTGYIPLTLGGDHSIAVGSVLGVSHSERYRSKDISLIWIDAHADLNTETSSKSGNLHGMPVSFLLKNCSTPKRELLQKFTPNIDTKNFVYIGLRDLDVPELELLKKLDMKHFSMREIDKFGIDHVMEISLDYISGPGAQNPLYVSFDIDSVDNTIAASTGTIVPGGLTLREALRIGEIVHETNRMIAFDMVEFNPLIGTPQQIQQTARTTIDIILAFFGKSRLGDYHVSKEDIKK